MGADTFVSNLDIVIPIQRRPSNDKSRTLGLCNFVGAKIKKIFETHKYFLKLFFTLL